MADQDQVEGQYHPKDAISATIKATAITAGAGAFISTIQNTLTKHNVGAFGAVSRFGGTTAVFGRTRSSQKSHWGEGEKYANGSVPQLLWAEPTNSARRPPQTCGKRTMRGTRPWVASSPAR